MPFGRGQQTAQEPAGRRKRFLFVMAYAVVLGSATVLLVLCLELGASFFTTLPSESFVRDARLNHTWPPGGSLEHGEWIELNPDFPDPYRHHYNAQGWLESYDITEPKPAGTYRIFYVGDSFTEGCVPMEESVPSRVEAALNERFADSGIHFEVINTGTSSYSPVIYYILIRYYIAPYSPDLIVIDVDMTDNFDDWKYRQTMIADDEGNPFAAPPRELYSSQYIDTLEGAVRADLLARTRLYLAENSFLYNLIVGSRVADRNRTVPAAAADDVAELLFPRWGWCQHEWNEQIEENVRFSIDILERIADDCNKHEIKLMLTAVPHYEQFATDESGQTLWSLRPHQEVRRVARRKSAVFLDSHASLLPQLQGSRQSDFYYKGNMHFNPRGNRLWAEAHIKALVDPANHLLPASVYQP